AERAFSRAWAKTGKRIAAKMAMMAMTTSSSIRVKPERRDDGKTVIRVPFCRRVRRLVWRGGVTGKRSVWRGGFPARGDGASPPLRDPSPSKADGEGIGAEDRAEDHTAMLYASGPSPSAFDGEGSRRGGEASSSHSLRRPPGRSAVVG